MRSLSSLGIGLSLVSGFLLLALVAELYYLLWWKKREPNREIDQEDDKYTLFFCWKKPNSLTSTALNPQEISDGQHQHKDVLIPIGEEEEGIESEVMRLHCLSGPPRFLFTIKEETNEDLESETPPFLTPLSSPPFFTPPLTPLDCYNPLFESVKSDDEVSSNYRLVKSSPPPKFKFLRDAEEKLYKKTLTEEAMKLHRINGDSPSKGSEEEDVSFITIIIGKNREKGHHPSSSQVNPLPSHGKLSSYLGSCTES